MSMEFKLGDLAALQKLRDSLIRDEMSEERGRKRLDQERWEAFKKTAQGIVGGCIFQVAENTRPCRAHLNTGRLQSLRDAVITQRALLGDPRVRVQKTAAVRTGLYAKTTPDAVLLIHQGHALRRIKGRPHRAGFCTRGIFALITEFGHKERL